MRSARDFTTTTTSRPITWKSTDKHTASERAHNNKWIDILWIVYVFLLSSIQIDSIHLFASSFSSDSFHNLESSTQRGDKSPVHFNWHFVSKIKTHFSSRRKTLYKFLFFPRNAIRTCDYETFVHCTANSEIPVDCEQETRDDTRPIQQTNSFFFFFF